MSKPTSPYEELLREKRRSILAGLGVKPEPLAGKPAAEEDRAQVSHDEFISTRLNSLEYVQLRLVEEALDRIRSGDYGICVSCEQPIPGKRLKALPWAKYCVPCQEAISAAEALTAHNPQAFR